MELFAVDTKDIKAMSENLVLIKEELVEIKKTISPKNSWLTVDETSKLLKVSRRTLQTYRDEGLLNYSKVQGRIFIKLADIEKMLEKYYINSEGE